MTTLEELEAAYRRSAQAYEVARAHVDKANERRWEANDDYAKARYRLEALKELHRGKYRERTVLKRRERFLSLMEKFDLPYRQAILIDQQYHPEAWHIEGEQA